MRMIERWFPCEIVSDASGSGWGSGNSEKSLFTWFAARPLAQARAAVLTSLLPWPDDLREQNRLQELVKKALSGRDEAHDEVVAELAKHYPDGATMLDPFSGRGMIPLEAARYGIQAWGIDYSPVATVAGHLLADYPFRDWSNESKLPFGGYAPPQNLRIGQSRDGRLAYDVEFMLREVGRRFEKAMAPYYPKYKGKYPWGYLWAITLPCQNCERRFPLTGSLLLRQPNLKKGDFGQSYRIDVDRASATYSIHVHEGPPQCKPTRVVAQGKNKFDSSGKVAVCPFCEHVHPKEVHTRLASMGLGVDTLLVVADSDPEPDREKNVGKVFREPTIPEQEAAQAARLALANEPSFPNGLPAVPDECIPPGNGWTIQPTVYGARTYGDLCVARQTLGFVTLARIIAEIGLELLQSGISDNYTTALCAYASAGIVRKLRRATRGATIDVSRMGVADVFGTTESSIGFSYDFFEAGVGSGAGTWSSLIESNIRSVENLAQRQTGSMSAILFRGSATSLRFHSRFFEAVVTDPPYDSMIDYSDASDLFYVWMKRALSTTQPEIAITMDINGVQEKEEEIIVKKGGYAADHRTREHYDRLLTEALTEARRVTKPEGVVTIVFGHGDPEVWYRLLKSITGAGLFLTGSWPAQTEKGGKAGSANIVATLTMCCRPAPENRPTARFSQVVAEVHREVQNRIPEWDANNLAFSDQLMAAAGPAMEVVGRYSEVLDKNGDVVESLRFIVEARRAVKEAAAIKIDDLPLETFDARTRFALFWAKVRGRRVCPKSDARWEAMVDDLRMEDLRGIIIEADKGVRLAYASEIKKPRPIDDFSPIVDVAFALARAWGENGTEAAGAVLAEACRDNDDAHLWNALDYLSSRLPAADPDGLAWAGLVRAKRGITVVAKETITARRRVEIKNEEAKKQMDLGLFNEYTEKSVA